MYISSWWAYTSGIHAILEEAVAQGKIEEDDIVWCGPSGDYVVAATAADLDDNYMEYSDGGLVSEYLHDDE